MKKILSLTALVTLVVLIATGCGGALVQNIDNSGYISGKKLSLSKVEATIKKGAMRRGWISKRIKPGLLEVRNNVRGRYLVVLNISFDTRGYKIMYKESQNLKYDPQTNKIHPNYNKWVANLERDINYELSKIGVTGNESARNVTTISSSSSTTASTSLNTSNYSKSSSSINTNGKTIYMKSIIPYAKGNRIAPNIKQECQIDKQLAEFIQQYAMQQGLTVKFKNNIGSNDLYLKVQIDDAISQGGAFRGHNKYTAISGVLVQGKKSFGSFKAARISGGGFWGAYKGSCSVLGRTVDTLGKDVAGWLFSPMDNAMLGDASRIRY